MQLHHPHILSLSVCALVTKIAFLVSTHTQTSSLTIPLVLTSATLCGVLAMVWLHFKVDACSGKQNENELLLRAMKKSAKSKKKSD